MLIGADILTPEKMKLDYESQRIIIGSCQNLAVPFNSHARKDSNLQRVIRAKGNISLAPHRITRIPISYSGGLLDDRNFFFEPQLDLNLGPEGGAFTYIIDLLLSFVKVYNATAVEVALSRRTRIGKVIENRHEGCFAVSTGDTTLVSATWATLKHMAKKTAVGATAALAAAAVIQTGTIYRPELPYSASAPAISTN